jgi:N-acetylglucosamine malate deacetylase 2
LAYSLLAVFAHPDDESFAVGGTLAKYASQGTEITLVTATRGELSTVGENPLLPEELGLIRERELEAAVRILGIHRAHLLGYPDGGLESIPHGKLSGRIAQIMGEVRPDVVITFHESGVTGHSDHRAISLATTLAFQQMGMTGRLYYWTVPQQVACRLNRSLGTTFTGTPESDLLAIDVRQYLDIQREAVLAHRSQSTPFPPVLAARRKAQHGFEYFKPAVPISSPPESAHDLFAGLPEPEPTIPSS